MSISREILRALQHQEQHSIDVAERLERIESKIDNMTQEGQDIMTDMEDLKAGLEQMTADVKANSDAVAANTDEINIAIDKLKEATNSGDPQAIKDAVAAVVAAHSANGTLNAEIIASTQRLKDAVDGVQASGGPATA